MKSCSRCLVTETADTISFDKTGSCSVCVQIDHKLNDVDWAARGFELDGVVSDAKARHGQYDVIIPFSGGKDSTYQLWFAVTQLKLRPLVVRYNHWGMRPGVERNNVRTFKKLGVEVIDFRPNWNVVRETMREALTRKGDSCWACHTGVYSFPMHMALKFNVPLIMWGESLNEYQSWFDHRVKESVDEVRFNRAMSLGMSADDMYQFLEGRVDKRDLFYYAYPKREDLDRLGAQSICLGDYVKWDTKAQVEIIKSELGWEGDAVEGIPAEFDYEKIECQFQGVRDWLKYLKRGFGRTNHLANIEIRHGRMTREEGAALAGEFDGKEPASLPWFLDILGMTRDEFYQIADSHVVDPWSTDGMDIEVGKELPDMKGWS